VQHPHTNSGKICTSKVQVTNKRVGSVAQWIMVGRYKISAKKDRSVDNGHNGKRRHWTLKKTYFIPFFPNFTYLVKIGPTSEDDFSDTLNPLLQEKETSLFFLIGKGLLYRGNKLWVLRQGCETSFATETK
jgi:hypothetical protein